MNCLKREKQIMIVRMMTEGCSLRSISRLTGCHRDSIGRLLDRVGAHCGGILDRTMRGLACRSLELDELWCYVFKKQKRIVPSDPPEFGDTYIFTALDRDSRLIPAFALGKRNDFTTNSFVQDLSARVSGSCHISTDGWGPYIGAVRRHFNGRADHCQVIKQFSSPPEGEGRYSPPTIVKMHCVPIRGFVDPDLACTSHMERANLTFRMQLRRLTRLTNGFTKRLERLRSAMNLHLAWYNLARIHSSLRVTPAMAAKVTGRVWDFEELLPDWGSN